MKLLVTGGAGFIGSQFVRAELAADPWLRVTVLDNLSRDASAGGLDAVRGHQGLELVAGDIRDAGLVDAVMAGQDAVAAFAAESHVDRSISGAMPFVDTNVAGTQRLLDAAVRHRVGRFVQVSTDEVYGSIASGAWREDQPLAPSSPYSASKAAADLLALACHHTHRLDVVITRCSNNYGPFQHPEKLIPNFVTRLLAGRRVPLYGDGGHVRDWLHVADHARGVGLALRRGRAGRIYHLGGGVELANRELTGRLLAACGAGWDRVEPVPDRKGHDRRYALDDSRSRAELGYCPEVDFETGLAETIAWYRDALSWWPPLAGMAEAQPG